MRIGLVRHFEVDCPHKWWMSAEEFRQWVSLYDCSPIRMGEVLTDQYIWAKCYCSDLYRTVATAQCIYEGTIIKSPLIREVPLTAVMELSIRIPYIFWLLAGRVAWFCSHQSQTETIKQTEERVNRFVLSILEEENVLIVTHGFLMVQIQEQLINNGFSGNCFKRAKCGKIYISEKENDGKS